MRGPLLILSQCFRDGVSDGQIDEMMMWTCNGWKVRRVLRKGCCGHQLLPNAHGYELMNDVLAFAILFDDIVAFATNIIQLLLRDMALLRWHLPVLLDVCEHLLTWVVNSIWLLPGQLFFLEIILLNNFGNFANL